MPSTNPVRISVIVPTLNEVDNIDELLRAVLAQSGTLFAIDVIVVDDGSTDGTQDRVRAWAPRAPVRLLSRTEKDGLAGAIIAGARLADTEIVIAMDADLSHPPEMIPKLVLPIVEGEKDMVIGSRYVRGGATPGWPLTRRLMSRAASALASPLTDVHDSLSGFFAVRRERILAVGSEAAGFKIALEILVRGGESLRVAEVPIAFRDRSRGASKMSSRVIFMYMARLLAFSGAGPAATKAARVRWIDAVEFTADFVVFLLLFNAGTRLGTSHIASFALASAISFFLKAPRSLIPATEKSAWPMRGRWLLVRIMALFARGGVLGLLAQSWHLPVPVAILAAIATSAAIDFAGKATFVSPATPIYHRGVSWRLAALGITLYLILLRLVYLDLPNLMPEEAYYWNYGQHLAPGYLDHPPMVAWLSRIGTTIFGHNEFGVRVGPFLCWFVASCFCFGLARRLYGKTVAFVTVLLLQVLPFFLSIGLILTPDAPLVACWAALLYFLYRALIEDRSAAWWGVGAALGLGMLSKYSIATVGVATLCFLLLDRPSRRWFLSPRPYVAVVLALAIFSPVIYWNATHEWASFAFQSSRRMSEARVFSLHLLVASVLALLTPTGAVAAVWALRKNFALARGTPREEEGKSRRALFVTVMTMVPLSVFVFFSLRHRVQFNWTGPSWLAVLPAVALGMTALSPEAIGRFQTWWQRTWRPTLVALIVIYGAGLHYLSLGLPGVPYSQRMELLPVGWDDFGRQVRAISDAFEKEAGQRPLMVGMDRYFIASQLAFYAGQDAPQYAAGLHLFGGISLMYQYWFPVAAQRGRPLVIVSFRQSDLEIDSVVGGTSGLGPIQSVEIHRDGIPVRRFYYRLARRFTGQPASPGAGT